MTAPPFLILALPRSRTFWLSKFLTYGEWTCAHDEAIRARGINDIRSWLSLPFTGSAETAAAPFWRLALDIRPDLKIVTIRRRPEESIDSLLRTGIPFDRAALERVVFKTNRRLDEIESNVSEVLSIPFESLAEERVCAGLFEHCLGLPHDHARWEQFDRVNLQVNLAAELRYIRAHGSQLRQVQGMCIRRIKEILRPVRMGEPDSTGITIQEEPFDRAWQDAQAIMPENCARTGHTPDAWRQWNVPLIRQMDEQGAVMFMTARCNGRVVGYLGTVLSNSFMKTGDIWATQLGVFVSADAGNHNLGLKLIQESAERAIKRKGASHVFMRAGLNGDGPRLDVLFRRVGAKDNGRLYVVEKTEMLERAA